ncbi:hypothetical protein Theco_1501 [Thermobacillus composti KWC4]|uniref:Lipoprotein n=1 Tax=Thermobacillus composti (strain DSM 18247 / JCM 13945 / KWC4) TaxID=717605 RepID=L0EES7_THECK|nr:hypothetical protein [Thermobacillus composti]AGA57650.1 hypothetical protein Theco_1501 [Thermobacillus composti KWC4]
MTTKRKIRLALLVAALTAAMAMTACADKSGNAVNDGAQNNGTPQNEAPQQDDGQKDDGGLAELREGSGIYIGQIDPHSIEIEVDGTPVVFQLGEGVADVLEGINPNDPVQFKYTEQPVEGDDTLKVLTITELSRAEGAGAGEDAARLPETKELDVELEGMPEKREATKAVGSGYAIYVFPQFTFDPETNRMSMNVDSNYYVDIEKLPAGYDPDEIRNAGEAWVKEGAGTVEEWTGDRIYKQMQGASLYLTGQKTGLTRTFVVKTIDGADYALKFNQPQGEASEGFLPLAFASVNSIVNTSR